MLLTPQTKDGTKEPLDLLDGRPCQMRGLPQLTLLSSPSWHSGDRWYPREQKYVYSLGAHHSSSHIGQAHGPEQTTSPR